MTHNSVPGLPRTPSKAERQAAQALCDAVWVAQAWPDEAKRRAQDIETAVSKGARLPAKLTLTRFEAQKVAQLRGITINSRASLADAVLSLAFTGTNWRVK